MHYHIYCNTRSIHTHHLQAITEYEKRLSAYCTTCLHLTTSLPSAREFAGENHSFIRIDSKYATQSSHEFAQSLHSMQQSGRSHVHIFIGYSESECMDRLSMQTTFPKPQILCLSRSQLSLETQTLLFYEQLYRGYTILQGKTYHK